VTNEIDFLDLYRQLRLDRDCGLQEFKQAYRRCVSRLHPDRKPRGYANSRAAQRLQQLNAQYDAAIEFERLHGRLPGATRSIRSAVPEPVVHRRRPQSPPITHVPRRPNLKLLIPIATVALGFLFWGVATVSPPPDTAPDVNSPEKDMSATPPLTAPMLTLGMSPENVRSIEGDPVMVHDDLWEYGPSWIRFDHDSVVDWYSSPLHSLKTASPRSPKAHD
jgi:hypothetical protein